MCRSSGTGCAMIAAVTGVAGGAPGTKDSAPGWGGFLGVFLGTGRPPSERPAVVPTVPILG